ncbi:tRNA uridine-5-carboxymethylaminomethyl(34) synthesis GTPase MnmE [uncultured Oscillibacter sp.]|uniref:tRNA uridine-5-carboxymethylaminomethyl(34) synthesis GTPase MnmE n=1 Tax=uncultured Oscillibacter sp. TaxID=876091 RepID=UPI0025F7F6DF|nr:tRNA uridine-5-carboxymethylaminomethyl(34) synthesis GTPase MnmE [uncultured Oscillibacter sp.]
MDVIAAIATGAAPTAIGIVRVSGDGCLSLCDAVFRANSGRLLTDLSPRTMVLGDMLDTQGRVIDHGLAVTFPGPHSYTGEDSAEFHCHGSPVVLRELLSALFAAGARQAGPGEFTKRAFLNGHMDLTEAEAVVDLIDAETSAAARNAAAQLSGALRRDFQAVTDTLLDIATRFYAVVDYPDEDIPDIHPQEVDQALTAAGDTLGRLLATCGRGRVLKRGVATAIVGRPNAGKSSLLNALAGYERAIVTDIPGTTRDTVEESVVCGGVRLRLMDTAGIRETEDIVEKLGVERSRQALEQADLALAVVDGSAPLTDEDQEILRLAARCPRWILVLNKQDLNCGRGAIYCPDPSLPKPAAAVEVSALRGDVFSLERAVEKLFPQGDVPEGSILTNERQEHAARRAAEAVARAREALAAGFTPDAILTDVEEALDALGQLTGRTAREEIVSGIFSRFCVGK